MKSYVMVTFIIFIGVFSFSKALAGEKHDCIYGSKIDQVISFYQGRLYLADSEYRILSEIGKDAAHKISYLKGSRSQLIKEMNNKDIEFESRKIRAYIVNKTRGADIGLGYTKMK